MTDKDDSNAGKDDSGAALVPPDGGERKLSIPYSVQRRRYSTSDRVVIVAVDPSDCAKSAFYWYIRNIWRPEDLAVIVFCPETPHIPSLSFKSGLSLPSDRWLEIMKEVNSKIQALEIDYENICIENKIHFKMRGESYKNPGEGICRIAHDEKADLIVLGSRGIGAVKRALLGSVSEYVIRHSTIATLVVHK